MARILVTGATGFIGGHIVRALTARGDEVVASGRNSRRLQALGELAIRTPRADLACDTLAPLLADCEAIVHCAALAAPWGPRAAFLRANVTSTERLLHAAQLAGVKRFVHLSSPSIYFRSRDQLDIRETPFTPPARWINAYAESKWLAEECIRHAAASGMTRIVLRPRAVFGEGDQTIFPRLLAQVRRGWFPLPAGGRALLDVTCVGNVADAVLAALDAPANTGVDAFNISNGTPLPVRDLLERLCASLHLRIRFRTLPRGVALGLGQVCETWAHLRRNASEPRLTRHAVGMIAYSQTLDISKARSRLGYEPRVDIDTGIARFAHWWQRHDHA